MTKKKYFVTGTDTGVGKTTISLILLDQFKKQGLSTAAIKPVASGAIKTNVGFRNDDALKLQKAITSEWTYEKINPFLLKAPISPNLAANHQNIHLTAKEIVSACQPVLNSDTDVVIVEGIGGWFVPINEKETMADVVKSLNIPVILVVGLRLGCLNHAILTYSAIHSYGLNITGWMANQIDPNMLYVEENIHYLKNKISAPFLGIQPFMGSTKKEFDQKTLKLPEE